MFSGDAGCRESGVLQVQIEAVLVPRHRRMESQPKKKCGLSGIEASGVIIIALSSVWLYGFPPESAMQWVDWFWGGGVMGMFSPAEMLLLLCAVVYWRLVLRHRR